MSKTPRSLWSMLVRHIYAKRTNLYDDRATPWRTTTWFIKLVT